MLHESQFPTAELSDAYGKAGSSGLPHRELKRFEVFDGQDLYASLCAPGTDLGALQVVGELQPSKADRKEGQEVKPVVVNLDRLEEVELRGDKTPQYWVRTSHAWYLLSTPHPKYQEAWAQEAMHLKLVAALERELASKNPRSFEQLVSRIARDVPGLKNDAHDFVTRVGGFVLRHFEARIEASPLLQELRSRVDSLGGGGALALRAISVPDSARVKRERDRECNKGNEWACELLGLPKPEKKKGSSSGGSKKRAAADAGSDNKEGGGGGDGEEQQEAAGQKKVALKQAKYVQDDLSLPGALNEPKQEFKELHLRIPQSLLSNVFALVEFLASFGEDIGRQGKEIGPCQVEEWLQVTTGTHPEFESVIRDMVEFASIEGSDPANRGMFGNEDDDDGGAGANNEDDGGVGEQFEVAHNLRMALRLKRMVPYLNTLTWEEVLRRFLYAYRREIAPQLLTEVMAALEGPGFHTLSFALQMDVVTFLMRKCLATKAMREWVDESQHNAYALRTERNKLVKDIKAKYKELIATPLPTPPAEDAELKRLKADIEEQTKEQERLRATGSADRNAIGAMTREINKLKKRAEDLEEELQAAYDKIAHAPRDRDEELREAEVEFDKKIHHEKSTMRVEPLGQDRWRRVFWCFERHRDTEDGVFVHDADTGKWSVIDDVEELKKFRNKLESRGVREKHLRARLSDAIPGIERRIQEEQALREERKTRRSRPLRERAFGRVLEKHKEADEEDDDEQEPEKKSPSKSPVKAADRLQAMQQLLRQTALDLPAGSIKADVRDRWEKGGEWKRMVDGASSAHELSALLVTLESNIVPGFLGREWTKQRESWIASCENELMPYPLFAFLLYMLEFSVDRNYNPKTGKSEKEALAKTHNNECTVCSGQGQLLCCDRCPNVYHMDCLVPPLYHIPRGAWVCPKCEGKRWAGSGPLRNPARSTRNKAVNYDLDSVLKEMQYGNPSRSTRNSRANYTVDQEEVDPAQERALRAERRKRKMRRAQEGDDDDDDDDDDGDDEEGDDAYGGENSSSDERPRKKKPQRAGTRRSTRRKKPTSSEEEEEDEEDEEEEDEEVPLADDDDEDDEGDGGDDNEEEK